jgi:hypothetical protein
MNLLLIIDASTNEASINDTPFTNIDKDAKDAKNANDAKDDIRITISEYI